MKKGGGAVWLSDHALTEINRIIGAAAFYNNVRIKPSKVIEDLLKLRDIPRAVQERLMKEMNPEKKEIYRWMLDLCFGEAEKQDEQRRTER